MPRRGALLVLLVLMGPIPACGDSGGGTGGNSSATAGSTNGSASVSATTGGPVDHSACPTMTAEAACAGAGCLWVDATFFPGSPANPPMCGGGSPTHACTYFEATDFTMHAWKRDDADGRVVIVTGGADGGVEGFVDCGLGDVCACFH